MRLAIKTGIWNPTPDEWKLATELLDLCEPLELKRILRLKMEEDRKRSLVGRLLLRYSCSVHCGKRYDHVRLERTLENKPICLDLKSGQVNVSHHGDWVVLASDMKRAVGIDVMKYEEPRRGKEAFFQTMKNHFTTSEWLAIDGSLENFYRFWSLKESYIKGLGIGLGFNLQRTSFIVNNGLQENKIEVEIDGELDSNWEFTLTTLDDLHCVAIALGPTVEDVDSHSSRHFKILTVSEILTLLVKG